MARPPVFKGPTSLWHASEGWRVFGDGEMDPGGAWHETEGGAPPTEATIRGLQADLLVARAETERVQRQIDAQSLNLSEMAAERDAANARYNAVVAKLESAGLAPPPNVQVPEDWEDLPFLALRALARKISGQPLTDKPSCEAAIREFVALTKPPPAPLPSA